MEYRLLLINSRDSFIVSSEIPEFAPTASLAVLQLRADLLERVREFFRGRGFLEVDTPLLSQDTVVDRHLDPLGVVMYADPRTPHLGDTYWLQTSPEFAMKRLLAAYRQSIFQITHAFRAGERGNWHNPEFTMLEWYGVGDDYVAGMDLLDEFSKGMVGRGNAERVSYRNAFIAHVGLDPFRASVDELAKAAQLRGVAAPQSLAPVDRDGWLDLLLVECVERELGRARPVILFDYPASQAALARVRLGDVAVAERFELYVDGVELANGYHELLDAQILLARAEANNAHRQADGKPALPVNSRLLAAMQHGLPPCTGVALGIDRLLMLRTGATSIDQVLPFPHPRA